MMLLGLGGSRAGSDALAGSGELTGSRVGAVADVGAADCWGASKVLVGAVFLCFARVCGTSSSTITTFFLRGALSLAPAGRPPLLFAVGSVLAGSCGSATGVVEGVFSTTSTIASSIFEILQGF